MLPETEPKPEKNEPYDWSELTQFWLDEMLADPELTDEQKQQLLREMELPEEEWELAELPEGAEPLSVTVIKMRRGECDDSIDWPKGDIMSPKIKFEEDARESAQRHYHWCIADMMVSPDLTDEQKQELLRQLELPDDEWEPTVLPEGAEPLSVTVIKMRRGEKEDFVLPTLEAEPQKNGQRDWSSLYEFCITDMLANPNLTDEQKQELLKELVMPEEEWEPIELPEGSESLSETIIKMRRGE